MVYSDFVFEPPSDEEVEYAYEGQSEEEEEDDDVDIEEVNETSSRAKNKKSQSPWDFSTYSESVADEHARRSTTSVDYKISKALQQRAAPIAAAEEDYSDSDSEPHHQVITNLFEFKKLDLISYKIPFVFVIWNYFRRTMFRRTMMTTLIQVVRIKNRSLRQLRESHSTLTRSWSFICLGHCFELARL